MRFRWENRYIEFQFVGIKQRPSLPKGTRRLLFLEYLGRQSDRVGTGCGFEFRRFGRCVRPRTHPQGVFARKCTKFHSNVKIPSFCTQNINHLLNKESKGFSTVYLRNGAFFVIVVLFAVCSFHAASGRFLICTVKRNDETKRANTTRTHLPLPSDDDDDAVEAGVTRFFFLSGDLNLSRVE